jgi:beta-N-acetylhexosaminidase
MSIEQSVKLPLGPVMVDVAGLALTAEEREFLRHPVVGAVILFARNYQDPRQLRALTEEIHAVREPRLLIAVDHEGGRVQRFREGFSRIPPMRAFGQLWERDQGQALELAHAAGHVIGAELAQAGVDFSFTPVLDVDFGASGVIGDRAFSRDPRTIGELAVALMQGLAAAGMAAVGKHFPGHGYAAADSHVAIPKDDRSYDAIEQTDLAPYRMLIPQGLAAIMPAHVIYPRVDPRPAGFSAFWLQEVLRRRLGFDGLIFSDDLTMEGASVAGDMTARARAAFAAGCDMVLVCNQPQAARDLVAALEKDAPVLDVRRAARMQARSDAGGALTSAAYRLAISSLHSQFGTGLL